MVKQRLSVEDCHTLSVCGRFEWSPAKCDEGFSCKYGEEEADREIMASCRAIGEWKEGESIFSLHSARGESKITQHILLTPTPCHYGGLRYWFLCSECERRVGKLYVPADGQSLYWACRYCYELTYEQRRGGYNTDFYSWQAHRLLERNGITLEDGHFHKPQGMRHRTFHQLTERYNALIGRANERFLKSFGAPMLRRLLPEFPEFSELAGKT